MLGAPKIALNHHMRAQVIYRAEGDDDSGAGTFYFTHLHFPGPSFEIDQCTLVLGDEPQIICDMQQMQVWSNISCHQKLVFWA